MTSLARILKPKLADFAKLLLASGFKVYLPLSDVNRVAKGGMESVGTWFQFSREVDGQTCYASVSLGYFESASFSMPIKPSRQNGSSMWIAHRGAQQVSRGDYSEALTVDNAKLYASMTGYNPLVGIQRNYADPNLGRGYVEVTA